MPVLCWFFIALTFYRKGACWRTSFLSASVISGVLLVAVTEVLSIFGSLNFAWALMAWGAAAAVSMVVYFTSNKREIPETASGISTYLRLLLAGVAIIILLTGLTAIIAPSNNWDSMTYHMSRVAHWIQNRTVAHYPTHIIRQLYLQPWAEFAITHLQLMSGGDYLANMVQWFSMLGSVLGVTLIAKRFGADQRGQVLAAVAAATIPMGVLQASSTQNDHVVSFWLVSFIYYGLLWKEGAGRRYALATGASLGIAVLTKGTAYIYAFPFLVWFVSSALRSLGRRSAVQLLLVALSVLSINLGHYIRNTELFGNPLSTPGNRYSNEVFNLSSVISNVSRNLALQVSTPSATINNAIESGVTRLHSSLGTGVNDPRTTWKGTEFHVGYISNHENFAQNPVHLALVALSVLLFLVSRRFRGPPNLTYYPVVLIIAFLLFSVYLKWQPWHSRLHLPLFVLWSPFVGIVLARVPYRKAANSIAVFLILAALPWVLFNRSRPLIASSAIISTSGLERYFKDRPRLKKFYATVATSSTIFNTFRLDQYFKNRPYLKESYVAIADSIREDQCSNVGLDIGGDDWEYPFWALLRDGLDRTVRIEHVNVKNVSGRKATVEPFDTFSPCYVISRKR